MSETPPAELQGPLTDAGASPPQDAAKSNMPKKAADVATIEELIEFAYGQSGKRLNVPRQVFESIADRLRSSASLADQERNERFDEPRDLTLDLTLGLARTDPLLSVPPRLLLEIEAPAIDALVRKRLLHLMGEVLTRHATFHSAELKSVLLTPPSDIDGVFDALLSTKTRVSSERLGLAADQFKPKDREALAKNSVMSLALFLSLRDRWTTEQLIECLHRNLWQRAAATTKKRPRQLVAESRTPETLGVVADTFLAQKKRADSSAEEHAQRAMQASRRASQAEASVDDRDRQLRAQAEQVVSLQQRIAEFKTELEAEQKSRVVDRSHHVDDYESLRTRVTRMLEQQSALLSDGLHALRNGSTTVTDEYLERALSAFDRELDRLKGELGET